MHLIKFALIVRRARIIKALLLIIINEPTAKSGARCKELFRFRYSIRSHCFLAMLLSVSESSFGNVIYYPNYWFFMSLSYYFRAALASEVLTVSNLSGLHFFLTKTT